MIIFLKINNNAYYYYFTHFVLGKGQRMVRIKDIKDGRVEPKKYWHSYTLQSLSCEKFAKLVNEILNREHFLMKLDKSNKLNAQD